MSFPSPTNQITIQQYQQVDSKIGVQVISSIAKPLHPQHLHQIDDLQDNNNLMINNYYFKEDNQYVPCHLIYTSQFQSTRHLYLGDVSSALDIHFINQNNVRTVVTAGAHMEQVYFHDKSTKFQINHIVYGVLDNKNQNLAQYFDQFFLIVQNSFRIGSILVHCAAGISRSSTLVISYLMKKHIWSFKQAIKYVRERRPSVLPNLGFERQLKQYQTLLFKQQHRKIKSKTSESTKHNQKYNQKQFYDNNNIPNLKLNQHSQLPQLSNTQSKVFQAFNVKTGKKQNQFGQKIEQSGKFQFKHNMFVVNNLHKDRLSYSNNNRKNAKIIKSHPFKIKIPTDQQIITKNKNNFKQTLQEDIVSSKSANLLSSHQNHQQQIVSHISSSSGQKNSRANHKKNFQSSNNHYEGNIHDIHNDRVLRSIVKPHSLKKQGVSINGLFDSAIIPIKYSNSRTQFFNIGHKSPTANSQPFQKSMLINPLNIPDYRLSNQPIPTAKNQKFINNLNQNRISLLKQKYCAFQLQQNQYNNKINSNNRELQYIQKSDIVHSVQKSEILYKNQVQRMQQAETQPNQVRNAFNKTKNNKNVLDKSNNYKNVWQKPNNYKKANYNNKFVSIKNYVNKNQFLKPLEIKQFKKVSLQINKF